MLLDSVLDHDDGHLLGRKRACYLERHCVVWDGGLGPGGKGVGLGRWGLPDTWLWETVLLSGELLYQRLSGSLSGL